VSSESCLDRSRKITDALAHAHDPRKPNRSHDQVNAGTLDIAQRLNGAFELAFQGPLIVHFLIEFRLSPIQLVEKLEASRPLWGMPSLATSRRMESTLSDGR